MLRVVEGNEHGRRVWGARPQVKPGKESEAEGMTVGGGGSLTCTIIGHFLHTRLILISMQMGHTLLLS